MTPRVPWFDRKFDFSLPVENYADVLERLRGTPARLDERCRLLPLEHAAVRVGGNWSLLENIGHLADLERLWRGRTDDLLSGAEVLRPADLENRATEAAGHNAASSAELLARFRRLREEWLQCLDTLDVSDFRRSARHPRLDESMRLIDLCLFVAAHDDHHLARIGVLLDV